MFNICQAAKQCATQESFMSGTRFVLTLLCPACSGQAQWLNYKTPGIPRTAEGKPNLSAPAPRLASGKPDFSGLWRTDNSTSADVGKAMDAMRRRPGQKAQGGVVRRLTCFACLSTPLLIWGWARWSRLRILMVMLFDGTLYREVFLDSLRGLADLVLVIPLVLVAYIFDRFSVRVELEFEENGQWFHERAGIGHRLHHFQVPEIGTPEPFRHTQRFGVRMSFEIQPRAVVETAALDHQSVSVPTLYPRLSSPPPMTRRPSFLKTIKVL
jgi:hypothetical protein